MTTPSRSDRRARPDVARDPGLDRYMEQIQGIPVLPLEEELELGRRYRAGDRAAGDKLVRSNLRLVAKLAHPFKGYGIPLMELIQEGNIGLLIALRRYDPERGLRFVTYARFWVLSCMRKHIMRFASVVPASTMKGRKMFFTLRSRLAAAEAPGKPREDVIAEVARHFEVEPEDVVDLLGCLLPPLSLHARVGDCPAEMLDLMEDQAPNIEQVLLALEAAAEVHDSLHEAARNGRERALVDDRLLSAVPRTLDRIGRDFGLTRERMRQIQQALLGRVRERMGTRLCADHLAAMA